MKGTKEGALWCQGRRLKRARISYVRKFFELSAKHRYYFDQQYLRYERYVLGFNI